MVDAEERLLAASEAFERAGDLAGKGWSTGLLAYVRIYDGRFTEADELARQTLLREQGDRWTQGMMNVALGTSALWSGRIDGALGHAESASRTSRKARIRSAWCRRSPARSSARARGRLDPGFQLLVSAEADHPFGPPNDMLRTSIAAASVTVGDAARAQQYLDGFDEIDIDIVGGSERHVALGLARLQEGDADAAFELLDALPGVADDTSSRWGWAVTRLRVPPRGVRSRRMPARWRRRAAVPIPIGFSLVSPAHVPQLEQVTMQALRLRLIGPAAVPAGGDQVFPTIVAVAAAVVAENSPSPSCRSVEQKPSRHSHGSVSLTQAGGRRCERRQASSRPVLSTLPARGRYRPRRHR